MKIRINKFLADHGIASRRAVDKLISEKRVRVNGIVLQKPGYIVCETDRVAIDGKEIIHESKQYVYILLNKPDNCVTTVKDTHGRKTVLDYIKNESRIFPIGRLDKNTTGVLLLTNDGDFAHALMHPRYSVEKVYRATINKAFTEKDKKIFERGIILDSKRTAPCKTHFFRNNKKEVIVSLHEGKNRQIHRMFGALGYVVQKLERIGYAGLDANGLQQGEWRHLTKKEIELLISNVMRDSI